MECGVRTYCKTLVLAVLSAGVIAGAAQAADQPGDNYVSLMLGGIVPDSERNADTGIAGGSVTITRVIKEHWDVEGQFGFLNIKGDSGKGGVDQDQLYVNANVLNIYNRGGRILPYLLGGLGYAQTSIYGQSDDNGFQASLGGGAMVPIFDDSSRLRAEFVGRWQTGDNDYLDWIMNLGISIPFGEKAEPMPEAVVVPAAPVDSDKDGVPDAIDRCPVTVANQVVDQYGCVLDGDRDGVPDEMDKCWDTPLNTPVDAAGCTSSSIVAPAAAVAPVATSTALPSSGLIALPGVQFRSNSDILLDGASASLDAAVLTLLDNPTVKIEVAGHTDNEGDPVANGTLSLARALVVRDYLIGHGVSPDRIRAHGYGDSEPVANNATEEGRAANRRVELRIKKPD